MAKPAVTDLDRQIGKRLKTLRKQVGASTGELAEAIDSTQQQISRYENGDNKISASQLYLLALSMDVPISWFFLDCTTEHPIPLVVKEPTPHYLRHALEEEVQTVQHFWSQLSDHQRSTLLRVLDSYLVAQQPVKTNT